MTSVVGKNERHREKRGREGAKVLLAYAMPCKSLICILWLNEHGKPVGNETMPEMSSPKKYLRAFARFDFASAPYSSDRDPFNAADNCRTNYSNSIFAMSCHFTYSAR